MKKNIRSSAISPFAQLTTNCLELRISNEPCHTEKCHWRKKGDIQSIWVNIFVTGRNFKYGFFLHSFTSFWSMFVYNTYISVCKYWPDTHVFITQTVELWNRWIILSCYYSRV